MHEGLPDLKESTMNKVVDNFHKGAPNRDGARAQRRTAAQAINDSNANGNSGM